MISEKKYNPKDVAIVIPLYKAEMTKLENIGFSQCNKIFQNYDRIIIAPNSLDVSNYKNLTSLEIRFENQYFSSLKTYNRLLLSEEFYSAFKQYKYILICQLDTFVFSNQLLDWCNKDYDYIGAPWINDSFRIFMNIAGKYSIFECAKLFFRKGINKAVGNGGLSLRKVETFLQCLQENKEFAENWKANEDYYWGLYAKTNGKLFKIPEYKEAAKFAIELKPNYCMNLNHQELPMGLHAWEKYHIEFWKPYINKAGYEI
ncbi:MAG: hypothetical protein HXX09_09980 [Bacteroidetes bacterium]|nr:hypothetical protein [Bacteroidota bacterium]